MAGPRGPETDPGRVPVALWGRPNVIAFKATVAMGRREETTDRLVQGQGVGELPGRGSDGPL